MNSAAITLRLALPRDAHRIAAMSRDLIETGLGWNYHPRRLAQLIRDPEVIALVACQRVRPTGFAVMAFGDERAHLVLLAVSPAHQRRGIGRRMLEWLLASAVTAGIASVHLEFRSNNEAARAFYRSMGFSETLRVPGYYGGREPATRMVRILRRADLTSDLARPDAE